METAILLTTKCQKYIEPKKSKHHSHQWAVVKETRRSYINNIAHL